MAEHSDLPYRPCAGIMLLNSDGLVFVGQRMDSSTEAWQMPQGGIDKGEDAQTAAFRELAEETGIPSEKAEIIATAREELTYDLPDELIGKIWKGKWRGQRQAWFLMRFLGDDGDINIAMEHQEFRAWTWAKPETLPELIVPFKRELYGKLLVEFGEYL